MTKYSTKKFNLAYSKPNIVRAQGVYTREQRMRRAPATRAVFSAGSRLDRIKP